MQLPWWPPDVATRESAEPSKSVSLPCRRRWVFFQFAAGLMIRRSDTRRGEARRRSRGFSGLVSSWADPETGMRIASRRRTTFLLLPPAKNHTCFVKTVSDTLSFSHVVRKESQSLFLPSDSSPGPLSFTLMAFKKIIISTLIKPNNAAHNENYLHLSFNIFHISG